MSETLENVVPETITDPSTDTTPPAVAVEATKEQPQMTVAECQVETQKHIETVRKYIRFMIDKIEMRGVKHDASKLETPEVELFAEVTPKLAATTYGSEEYNGFLDKLKPALDHHYASNRHHPQHFVNGINDMTLIDIIEMFCDWKASTLRQNDGNLLKSIEGWHSWLGIRFVSRSSDRLRAS